MISNSAFITIGESRKTLEKVAQKEAPGAEYAVLRNGHFSNVLAMADGSLNPGSMAHAARYAVRAYLETWNQENIYLGEEFPGIQYLAVHALMRRRKRIAMLIHNVVSIKRRVPLANLRLVSLVDHLLCLSEQSAKELQFRYGVPREKITVVGSRVDTKFFTPDAAATVLPQVCSAGAINRDYECLMEATRQLSVPTKIAADTAWRYSAGEKAVGPLPAHVEMRSWGTYLKLRDLYAESAVVVVPLRRAMLSGVTVALEAMAMGRPVILTRNPYVEEFMQDGRHGFFVPEGDVQALRGRIEHLLKNPAEASQMGAEARKWVLEHFTVERYVERILSVWQR